MSTYVGLLEQLLFIARIKYPPATMECEQSNFPFQWAEICAPWCLQVEQLQEDNRRLQRQVDEANNHTCESKPEQTDNGILPAQMMPLQNESKNDHNPEPEMADQQHSDAAEIQALVGQIEDLKAALSMQQDKAAAAQHDKAEATKRVEQLSHAKEQIEHQHELEQHALEDQIAQLTKRCSELEGEARHLDQLKAQLALATRSEDAAHTTLTHLENERELLSSQIQELKQGNHQLESSLKACQDAFQQENSDHASLVSRMQVVQQESTMLGEDAQVQSAQHQDELDNLQAELESWKCQHREAMQRYAELQDHARAESEQHREGTTKLNQDASTSKAEVQDLQAQLTAAVHASATQQAELA